LTSVEKSVHTSRSPEPTNKPVDKPFSCVLMHQGDLERETTVNDANLRSGGSVPEWEGHLNIWVGEVRARMLHNL
jgi:hypothetical protein